MERFDSHDMLTVIFLLNRSDLACNITVYTLVEDGVLESVEHSDNRDSTPKLSVIVQDKGMVFPLYTLHELEKGIKEMIMNKLGISDIDSDPEVVLKTVDGTMYCPGNPGDIKKINTVLFKCLKPVHLLHLMANANIATSKVNQLLKSQDTNRALDSFDSKDVRDILLELDKYVAHNFVVYMYVLHDHDRDGLSHIQTSNCETNTTPVLLMDKGKVCILQEAQGDSDDLTLQASDGQRFIQGPVDYFHNVVFKSMETVELLHMLELIDGTTDFDQLMLDEGKLQRYSVTLRVISVFISLLTNQTMMYLFREFSTSGSDTNQPQIALLITEDGMICRLHLKQTVEIPHFMKEFEFVKDQLPRYIRNAFHALVMTEKREYLVSDDGSIHPIDFESTGVVQTNRTWSGGLQQMLALCNHQLPLPCWFLQTLCKRNFVWTLWYNRNRFRL